MRVLRPVCQEIWKNHVFNITLERKCIREDLSVGGKVIKPMLYPFLTMSCDIIFSDIIKVIFLAGLECIIICDCSFWPRRCSEVKWNDEKICQA